MRSVAIRYGVSLSTVQRWVGRAAGQALEAVDWNSHPPGPRCPANHTSQELEDRVLQVRQYLKEHGPLGYYGAVAIREHMAGQRLAHVPTERTINRILRRRGALDGDRRPRLPAPPPGWYLPDVVQGRAEVDIWDTVEGLVIQGGTQVEVLNVTSLRGHLVDSFPKSSFTAPLVRDCLLEHWSRWGLPHYAQFDNATLFQGPHQHPDTIGSVSRLCLQLGVTPVFVPVAEYGFQAAIENYNGNWQARVWRRFQHQCLAHLVAHSALYVQSHQARTASRRQSAPDRPPFPGQFRLDLQQQPRGQIVFLRRSNDQGAVSLLGHSFPVAAHWPYRLVRCHVHLSEGVIRFYALRRREPFIQPLLAQLDYHLPRRSFRE